MAGNEKVWDEKIRSGFSDDGVERREQDRHIYQFPERGDHGQHMQVLWKEAACVDAASNSIPGEDTVNRWEDMSAEVKRVRGSKREMMKEEESDWISKRANNWVGSI